MLHIYLVTNTLKLSYLQILKLQMAWENFEHARRSAIVRPSERLYTWIGVITAWITLLTNISYWSIDIVLMYEVELQPGVYYQNVWSA